MEVALGVHVAVLLCTAPEDLERFGSGNSDAFETGPIRGHASCLIMRWRFGLDALGTGLTCIDWLVELPTTGEECTDLVSRS